MVPVNSTSSTWKRCDCVHAAAYLQTTAPCCCSSLASPFGDEWHLNGRTHFVLPLPLCQCLPWMAARLGFFFVVVVLVFFFILFALHPDKRKWIYSAGLFIVCPCQIVFLIRWAAANGTVTKRGSTRRKCGDDDDNDDDVDADEDECAHTIAIVRLQCKGMKTKQLKFI